MSESITLTILDTDDPDRVPAHESTHPDVDTAADALETVLLEAGEGDRAVRRPQDDQADVCRVYDLVDRHGRRVGTAITSATDDTGPADEHSTSDHDDYRAGDDYADATHHFAGPFCGCGDYSCDAATDSAASCVNRDD